MSERRMWTLGVNEETAHDEILDGPTVQGPVRVVELDPILDLLERSTAGTDVAVFDGNEIIAFLKAHGRLGNDDE